MLSLVRLVVSLTMERPLVQERGVATVNKVGQGYLDLTRLREEDAPAKPDRSMSIKVAPSVS